MSKNVLIVTGDAVEALEVFYPYYRCMEEGYVVTIASPTVKVLHTVSHDFVEGMETYVEKPSYGLKSDLAFDEVEPEQYDGLIIPGGRAPEYIRLYKSLPPIIRHFFETDKPIAAVCHAAQVLTVVPDLMKGREYTAYGACMPDVLAVGATYMEVDIHTDGNLVSGRVWSDLPALMREFVAMMNNEARTGRL